MSRTVYLLTDFGLKDYYVAAMKTVLLDLSKAPLNIIDVTHYVEPGNILQGSFILWQLSLLNIHDSLVLAVVDPGVGTERDAILVECNSNNVLVGPDNGVLYPLAKTLGIKRIFSIDYSNEDFFPNVSYTFHGRDVFARAAGLYLAGERSFLKEKDSLIKNEIFVYRVRGDEILFKVLNIDRFGNIITNVPCSIELGSKVVLTLGAEPKEYLAKVVSTFSDLNRGEVGVLCGSSGLYEIVCNHCSAAEALACKIGSVGRFRKV